MVKYILYIFIEGAEKMKYIKHTKNDNNIYNNIRYLIFSAEKNL